MRLFIISILISFFSFSCNQPKIQQIKTEKTEKKQKTEITLKNLDTIERKASYIMGWNAGQSFKKHNFGLDEKIYFKAFKDAFEGKKSLMTEKEKQKALAALQAKMSQKYLKKHINETLKNKKEGKLFLEKNKEEKGIKVTKSGLQYKILKKGKGPKPSPNDTVKVHYKGFFLNGKEFDSSYKVGKPLQFKLSAVIKGWGEGVQLMSKGAKYKFWIPSNLAYGDKGVPGKIEGGSTLVFEVELLDIIKKGNNVK